MSGAQSGLIPWRLNSNMDGVVRSVHILVCVCNNRAQQTKASGGVRASLFGAGWRHRFNRFTEINYYFEEGGWKPSSRQCTNVRSASRNYWKSIHLKLWYTPQYDLVAGGTLRTRSLVPCCRNNHPQVPAFSKYNKLYIYVWSLSKTDTIEKSVKK